MSTIANRSHLDVSYYAELQKRLFEVFLFVSCDKRNFNTFSMTLASVFLDAASYFDSLSQTFISHHTSAGNHFKGESTIRSFQDKIDAKAFFNMNDYRAIFETEYLFSDKTLNLNTHGDDFYSSPLAYTVAPNRAFDIKPFTSWSTNTNPDWWKAFTKVKHDRILNMDCATLENTIQAYGAVLIVLTFFHEKFMQRHNRALETYRLFTPKYWKVTSSIGLAYPGFASI